ncbi:MAG: hypothetical protein AB9891_17970 [Anaerolineaceae bacterium]
MTLIKYIKPQFHNITIHFLYLICSLIVLTLLLGVPISRQIGLTVRYDFFIPIILFLVFFFPAFLQANKYIKAASFVILLVIFVLPLSGLWSSGQSEQYLLGGIIPFSDARGYFADTRSLIEGGDFFTTHSRRPLFSAFLAPILAAAGNHLQLSLAIIVILTAAACYLSAREIQASQGSLAALLVLILLFFFYRPISGKVLSEDLGFPLCVLGLTFFLYSARKDHILSAYSGLFLVSLALCARAGAFFLLPALFIWIVWHFHGSASKTIKVVLVSIAAIVLAFAINHLIYIIFVSSDSPAFGNFSYTFYGLAVGGKGWQQILVDHPEIGILPEPAYSQKVMELAFEVIKRKPMNLLVGSFRSWAMFFSTDDYYSLFNWVNGSRPIIGTLSRLGMYVLIVLGIVDGVISAVRRRLNPLQQLSILAFLGIVLSVPFAPPLDSNRMRIYASVMPFLLLLPAAGFSSLFKWQKTRLLIEPRESFSRIGSSVAISIVIFSLLLIGPFITRLAAKPIPVQAMQCLPDQSSVTIRLSPGSLVNITDPEVDNTDWLPNIRQNTFITRAHNLPNWETFPLIDNLPSYKTIANEIDLTENKIILFIADTNSLPVLPALIQSCGKYSDDKMVQEYDVFFADSIQKID